MILGRAVVTRSLRFLLSFHTAFFDDLRSFSGDILRDVERGRIRGVLVDPLGYVFRFPRSYKEITSADYFIFSLLFFSVLYQMIFYQGRVFYWYPPLDRRYLEYKRKRHRFTCFLISTGLYVSSFRLGYDPQKRLIALTVKPWQIRNSRYTYLDLAIWLEFGTSRMPPRPHWRPALFVTRISYMDFRKRLVKHLPFPVTEFPRRFFESPKKWIRVVEGTERAMRIHGRGY